MMYCCARLVLKPVGVGNAGCPWRCHRVGVDHQVIITGSALITGQNFFSSQRAIAKQYATRLEPIQREFNRKMKPLRERLERVRHAVRQKADEFTVSVPPRPEPNEAGADESFWLYDSQRGYEAQIEAYKRHKE